MEFQTIYNNIADNFEDASGEMRTRIKRYINDIQQDICSRANWDFLLANTYFQCTAPYTTGTAYASGTALTGVGTTFTSSMVGRKVRIGSESEYYTISAFVSTTSLTLDQSYLGAYDTSDEATTYSIYQDIYSLTSDTEKIISIVNPTNISKLTYLSRQDFDSCEPNPTSTGTPEYYTEAGLDSNGYFRIQLVLPPDDDYVMYYWYRKQLADLNAVDDVSGIPTKYQRLLYLGGLAHAYEFDNNPLATTYWTHYENMIKEMIKDYMSGPEDNITVLKPYGRRQSGSSLRLPPAHFRS